MLEMCMIIIFDHGFIRIWLPFSIAFLSHFPKFILPFYPSLTLQALKDLLTLCIELCKCESVVYQCKL